MACDLATLVSASAGYNGLSESQNKDAYLFLLAKTLVASDGEDYTDINDLREAVKCYCGLGLHLDALKTQVIADLAVRNRAYDSLPSVVTVKTSTKCWECGLGDEERRAMEIFLLCALFAKLVP